MPHLYALIYISLSLICFYQSYRQFTKNNFRLSALFLTLAGLSLRIYTASDLFLHEWDERYHALVAKNMLESMWVPKLYRLPLLSYDYKEWFANYIWLHKQPLPLWCMAISMKLFGVHEWAMRLPSVVVSTLSIYLTYLIGRKAFSEKVALLAAFFHSINGLIIELTAGRIATDHVDVFFLFFVEGAVFFSVYHSCRNKMLTSILTGVCIGCAVLCKWLPGFVVLPVWLALNFDASNLAKVIIHFCVIVIVSLLILLPWQFYAYSKFPMEYAHEMLHNYRHITEVLDRQTGPWYYFLYKLFITVNEFIWIAVGWVIWKMYKDGKINRSWLAMLVWIFIPLAFFSFARTKMQAYLIFVYPALFLALSAFCYSLLAVKESLLKMRLAQLAMVVLVFLSIRYSIERIKPFRDQSNQIAWADEFRKMEKTGADKRVYFNVGHYIEGMFYTESIMYGFQPSEKQVSDLKEKGYEVIINTTPGL